MHRGWATHRVGWATHRVGGATRRVGGRSGAAPLQSIARGAMHRVAPTIWLGGIFGAWHCCAGAMRRGWATRRGGWATHRVAPTIWSGGFLGRSAAAPLQSIARGAMHRVAPTCLRPIRYNKSPYLRPFLESQNFFSVQPLHCLQRYARFFYGLVKYPLDISPRPAYNTQGQESNHRPSQEPQSAIARQRAPINKGGHRTNEWAKAGEPR